jgi:hypothetical protein
MKVKKHFKLLAQYIPQTLVLLSVLTSNVFFPAVAIAEEISDLKATNTQVEDYPIDESEDILDEGISTNIFEEEVVEEAKEPLFVFEDGIYTVNTVVEGEEYVYPDNGNVRITFNEVTEEGNLVISRVELTDEQKELLNTTDEYGWDISSSMSNGSFKYDLILPNTQGDDIEVKYTEDGSNYESVENVNVNKDIVVLSGLDHFTTFVVVNPLPGGYTEGDSGCPISSGDVCYNTIQEAITNSSNNDTIYIEPGTYPVTSTINVNKSLTITGSTSGTATVEAQNSSTIPVFHITTNDVTIENLEITTTQSAIDSYGSYDGLIHTDSNLTGLEIRDNEIYSPSQGARDTMGTWHGRGVYIERNTEAVIDNNIVYNLRTGIFGKYGSTVTITNNTVYNTKGGIMNHTSNLTEDSQKIIMGNSWEAPDPALSHSQWDIVWNSGGSYPDPMPAGHYEHVVADSISNNDGYVIDQRGPGTTKAVEGNRSHAFVEASSPFNTAGNNLGNILEPYSDIQLGIDSVAPGGKVVLWSDFTIGQQINIRKECIIEGNGHTIYSNFDKAGDNSNNSAFGLYGNNIVLKDLIIDGSSGVDLHGITTYVASDLLLKNISTINNPNAGIIVNGSTVTLENITTAGNGWYGINVDQGYNVTAPSELTILGMSSHDEPIAIYIDDTTKDVSVIPNNQYYYSDFGNARIYFFDDIAPPIPTHISPSDGSSINSHSFTADWNDVTDSGTGLMNYDIEFFYNGAWRDRRTVTTSQRTNTASYDLKWDWRVRARDNAGNVSDWSEPWTVTLDTTKPTIEILTPSPDTTHKGTFDIVVKAEDTLSGIGQFVVNLKDKNGAHIAPCVNEDGGGALSYSVTCTIDTTNYPDGEYKIKTNVRDRAGNLSQTLSRTFYFDNSSPQIKATKMLVKENGNWEESYLTKSGDEVKVWIEVEDEYADIDRVQIWIREYPWNPNNNELISGNMVMVDSTHYEFIYTVPDTYKDGDSINETFEGNYFNFRPWDTLGNSHIGWRDNFTIDNTAPTAPTGLTLFDHEGNALGCAGYTDNRNILIDWGDNPETDVAYYLLDLKDKEGHKKLINSQYYGHIRNTDDYYRYKIRAVDFAGNVSLPSDWCGVTLDRVDPIVDITSHEDFDWVRKEINIKGFSSDINLWRYWFVIEDTTFGTQVAGLNTIYPTSSPAFVDYLWNTNNVGDGQYTIKLEARDKAGNKDPNEAPVSMDPEVDGDSVDWVVLNVDNTRPEAEITDPTVMTYTNDTITFSGRASDKNLRRIWLLLGDENGKPIKEDGKKVICSELKDSDLTNPDWNNITCTDFDVSSYPEGTYSMIIEAWDMSWNYRKDHVLFELDKTAPEESPTIVFPNENDYFNTTPILNDWTDVTDENGIKHYRIEYVYDDNHSFSNMPYRYTTSTQRNHTPGDWEEGGVKFRVQGIDNAGNEGPWSEWRHYYFDQTAPQIPSELYYEANEEILACNSYTSSYNIIAEWEDSTDDVTEVSHYEYQSFNPPTGWIWTDNNPIYTSKRPGAFTVEEGTYGFRVRAVDMAGNKSDWSAIDFDSSCKITYDATKPTSPENLRFEVGEDELSCGARTNIENVKVVWDDSFDNISNSDDIKYLYEVTYTDPETEQESTWTTTVGDPHFSGSFAPKGEGLRTIRVKSIDQAGNESKWSLPCSIFYDITDPEVLFANQSIPEILSELPEYSILDQSEELIDEPVCTVDEGITFPIDAESENSTFEVTCTYSDTAGNSNTSTYTITVTDVPISVILSADDTEVLEGDDPVILSTTVTGGNDPHSIAFSGDCADNEDGTATIATEDPGEYTCTVEVTDADGDTDSDQISVSVGAVLGEATDNTQTENSTGNQQFYASNLGTGAGNEIEEDLEITTEDETNEEEVLGEERSCENPVKVYGYIYHDKNSDGEVDDNEDKLEDISVRIYYMDNGNEVTVADTQTDENGYWETNLCQGEYTLEIDTEDLPENLVLAQTHEIVIDEDTQEYQLNLGASDSRSFLQKYWYIVLIGAGILLTVIYLILSKGKKQQTYQ